MAPNRRPSHWQRQIAGRVTAERPANVGFIPSKIRVATRINPTIARDDVNDALSCRVFSRQAKWTLGIIDESGGLMLQKSKPLRDACVVFLDSGKAVLQFLFLHFNRGKFGARRDCVFPSRRVLGQNKIRRTNRVPPASAIHREFYWLARNPRRRWRTAGRVCPKVLSL